MRHNPDRGIMTQLMQRRAMPVNRLEISRWRRHLYIVFGWPIERAVAADAEVDTGRLDQRLHARLDHAGQWRRRNGCNLVR